ncbi:MAG: oligopeptide/dipeptide ABC transporter ATP-binding protein, partial [Thermoplasmata archaeon]
PKDREEKIILVGERPDPSDVPPGCRFHPRCPSVMDICRSEEPKSVFVSPGHSVCCHLLIMQGAGKS